MNNKKWLAVAAVALVAASLIVQRTFSWFTSERSKISQSLGMPSVNVDLEIKSYMINEDGVEEPSESLLMYPSNFYDESGNIVPNAKGVISYTVTNRTKGNAIARVNQSGILFQDPADPENPASQTMDDIEAVDLRLYQLEDEYIYPDEAPDGTMIPFVDYDALDQNGF
jgi:hypothetical protein